MNHSQLTRYFHFIFITNIANAIIFNISSLFSKVLPQNISKYLYAIDMHHQKLIKMGSNTLNELYFDLEWVSAVKAEQVEVLKRHYYKSFREKTV